RAPPSTRSSRGDRSAAAAGPATAAHAALAQLFLECRGDELHHRDAALDAEQLDLSMESLGDPRGELDQDVIVFGHRSHPPSASACAGCYLTYLGMWRKPAAEIIGLGQCSSCFLPLSVMSPRSGPLPSRGEISAGKEGGHPASAGFANCARRSAAAGR